MQEIRFRRAAAKQASAVKEFLAWWGDHPDDRLWLAAWIGDWVTADQEARRIDRADLSHLTRPYALTCRTRWRIELCTEYEKRGPSAGLLGALSDAEAHEAAAQIEQSLAEADQARSTLEVIADDPAWCPRVFELLMHFKQPEDATSYLPYRYASYLGRHDFRVPEVIAYLLREKAPPYRVILPMAAKHAPGRIRELGEAGLRSKAPEDRLTAAALLVHLGQSWCEQLLMKILDEVDNPEMALECLAALECCESPEARTLARRWAEQHADGLLRRVPRESERCLFLYCIKGVRGELSIRISQLCGDIAE